MDFGLVQTTGELNDKDLCLIDEYPEGMEKYGHTMALGKPATPHFPKDAIVRLSEDNPGIKLAHVCGNLQGCFIGSSLVKKIISKYCSEQEIEYLPFTLYNHKGRVHSTDYYFINPIGGIDCLNYEESGAEFDNGEFMALDKVVLDREKIENAPHFFRVEEERYNYVMSLELVKALRDEGVDNLLGKKLKAV